MVDLLREEIDDALTYAGLVLVAWELVQSIIVKPIRIFYGYETKSLNPTVFGEGMPFKSYEEDVLSRDASEFQACLLYLRDFVEAIDAQDEKTIQELRRHRNDIAHNLVAKISGFDVRDHLPLLDRVNQTLFKVSNHRAYIEIGAEPGVRAQNWDWESVKGHEYLIFERIIKTLRKHYE